MMCSRYVGGKGRERYEKNIGVRKVKGSKRCDENKRENNNK